MVKLWQPSSTPPDGDYLMSVYLKGGVLSIDRDSYVCKQIELKNHFLRGNLLYSMEEVTE